MKRQIWIDTLQWFIGLYIAIRGTLMLMLPHTLSTHVFVPIQPYLPWLATWQVLGGVLLIAAVTLVPRRPILLLAHFLAGSSLLQAAAGHLLAGTWTAVADFTVLGLGTAIAPFLHQRRYRHSQGGLDWFAVLMGIRMVLDGIIVLTPFNPQFNASLYDPVRPHLPLYGIGYLVSSLALLAAYFYPRLPRWFAWGAHVAAGGVLWSWTLGLGVPTWNSVLFYGGLGTLLALVPWISPYLRRLDPDSLQTQLAVTLVGIVTLPLLFAVTLITLPQEKAIINQALTVQQTFATVLSGDIASYVNLHRAAVHALAKQPNLATMLPLEQQDLLERVNQEYPDLVVLATYDADGKAIARSDGHPPGPSITELNLYKAARQFGRSTLTIRTGRVIQKPMFTFTAPSYTPDRQFAGVVAGAIESSRMADQLIEMGESANIQAYLVDEVGRVIAHPDSELVSAFTDYSQMPPVSALLESNTTFGNLHYWDESQWQLAGYAQIPDLGWGVVVERPVSDVLMALNARRNRDFQTLVVVAVAALTIGLFVARKLSNSLTTLAYATDQFATGDTKAPLPQSRITEVAHLSNVFAAMRDRLARRTAERDQMEQEREKLLQRERAAREEAETANRIKDEFLAVLSHELRSPLNPILGWSQLLRTGRLNAKKTAEALETIERNAKLQTQLIEDLLDVSRILRGKLSLNMAPVNLVVAVEAALETVQLAAEAKSIDIRLKMGRSRNGCNAPIQVLGDSARLQQIIWNLLSNAVKFTPEGGWVEVQVESSELTDSAQHPPRTTQHGYAQIQVRDNGKGIPPNFLPHVFEYFRQADSTTTRKFGGLGLGLAIVRHLVELHGGTVWADSPGEGQGATFTVQIPLLKTNANEQPDETVSPHSASAVLHPLQGIRVLIVDDEADARDLMAFLLEEAGASLTIVESAMEALELVAQLKPDVLVSDVGMPEMDGYMLIQYIRKRPAQEGGQIPAIALTAYAGEMNQRQAIAAGFQKHISKPVEPQLLIEAIVTLVGQR